MTWVWRSYYIIDWEDSLGLR